MSQRLVLKPGESLTLGQLEAFIIRAKEIGFTSRAVVNASDSCANVTLWLDIPGSDKAPVAGKKRLVVRKKTKREVAVEEQIAKYKSDRAAGVKVAHVKPVKGTVKRVVKKKRGQKNAGS